MLTAERKRTRTASYGSEVETAASTRRQSGRLLHKPPSPIASPRPSGRSREVAVNVDASSGVAAKKQKAARATKEDDPFVAAKRAFHRSGSFRVVGRVEEKAALTNFWHDCVLAGISASIYVSGNPGTGKTALVDEVFGELGMEAGAAVRLFKTNCMMLKDPLKVFAEIAGAVGAKEAAEEASPLLAISKLEQYFDERSAKKGCFWVLIVDEVDQVSMRDPELLCRLLALPYGPLGTLRRVAVVGIANSIDLTERFLPRLKLMNGCEPKALHFPQYSIADISAILTDRLEAINTATATLPFRFIDSVAVEFAARKVASTGDLRRALDMMRQAIEVAEDEYRQCPETEQRRSVVSLSHVAKIVEKFGGGGGNGPLAAIQALNLHQKVILAAIVGHQARQASMAQPATPTKKTTVLSDALTTQRLFESYTFAAQRPPRLYEAVGRSEFADLMANLEAMAVVGRSAAGNDQQRVFLLVPAELVRKMLDELPTIRALFE